MLLVSDANILIDIERGGLIASMFSLDYQFVVPDLLFYEELEAQHAYLLNMGLETRIFDEPMVAQVMNMAQQYTRASPNDLFALLLAIQERCPLLTGDKYLKTIAENKDIQVLGTLWLVNTMIKKGNISVTIARDAYQKMRMSGRRLPWDLAEQLLLKMETELIDASI